MTEHHLSDCHFAEPIRAGKITQTATPIIICRNDVTVLWQKPHNQKYQQISSINFLSDPSVAEFQIP